MLNRRQSLHVFPNPPMLWFVLGVVVPVTIWGVANHSETTGTTMPTAVQAAERERSIGSATQPANELPPGVAMQKNAGFASATIYTTRPLTFKEAESFHIARMPKEARDLQIAISKEWLTEGTLFVSYNAPPEICRSTAVELLKDWNQANPRNTVSTELHPIIKAARTPNREELAHISMAWFAPEAIVNGLEGGGGLVGQGRTVRVWVDLDLGRLFYQELPDPPQKDKTGRD